MTNGLSRVLVYPGLLAAQVQTHFSSVPIHSIRTLGLRLHQAFMVFFSPSLHSWAYLLDSERCLHVINHPNPFPLLLISVTRESYVECNEKACQLLTNLALNRHTLPKFQIWKVLQHESKHLEYLIMQKVKKIKLVLMQARIFCSFKVKST